MNENRKAILWAILAAACYGVSSPFSKLLLAEIQPTFLAALLYLGAGIGMALLQAVRRQAGEARKEAALARRDLPYVAGMILLDIAAPILLMIGLTRTTAANASLLNNFEIVATSLLALLLFREPIGRRMACAIALITLASVLLTVGDEGAFSFSGGSLLVLAACACWGLENNCTRMLSMKNPTQIVIVKGLGSGAGSLLVAWAVGEVGGPARYIAPALLLGFFAYGLSIYLYILAQRHLGAARTSAFYAVAPFIGVALSFALFAQPVTAAFAAALAIMLAGSYLAAFERHAHPHAHEALRHEHRHRHDDGHHAHVHEPPVAGEHSHPHAHDPVTHTHPHTPDLHHRHSHA